MKTAEITSPSWIAKIFGAINLTLIPFWLALIGYWAWEILHGVPDAYRNQHRLGLLLCAGGLTQSIAGWVANNSKSL